MIERSLPALVAMVVATASIALAAPSPAPSAKPPPSPKPVVSQAPGKDAMTCMTGSNQPWKLGSVMHQYNVQIGFTKSAGNAATLQAGQCAFASRAVSASEPSQICFAVDLTSNALSLHGTGYTLDPASTFSDGSKRGALLQDVVSGTPASVTMNVTIDGSTCFKIVQITSS